MTEYNDKIKLNKRYDMINDTLTVGCLIKICFQEVLKSCSGVYQYCTEWEAGPQM